jgi:hypothetical protein
MRPTWVAEWNCTACSGRVGALQGWCLLQQLGSLQPTCGGRLPRPQTARQAGPRSPQLAVYSEGRELGRNTAGTQDVLPSSAPGADGYYADG